MSGVFWDARLGERCPPRSGGRSGRFERFILPSEFPALAKFGPDVRVESFLDTEFLVCCFWHGSLRSGTRGPRRFGTRKGRCGVHTLGYAALARGTGAGGRTAHPCGAETLRLSMTPYGLQVKDPLLSARSVRVGAADSSPRERSAGIRRPPLKGLLATSTAVCSWRAGRPGYRASSPWLTGRLRPCPVGLLPCIPGRAVSRAGEWGDVLERARGLGRRDPGLGQLRGCGQRRPDSSYPAGDRRSTDLGCGQ